MLDSDDALHFDSAGHMIGIKTTFDLSVVFPPVGCIGGKNNPHGAAARPLHTCVDPLYTF